VNPARHAQVKALFLSLLDLGPAERAAALDSARAEDASLAHEVADLLAHASDGPSAEPPEDPDEVVNGRALDPSEAAVLASHSGSGVVVASEDTSPSAPPSGSGLAPARAPMGPALRAPAPPVPALPGAAPKVGEADPLDLVGTELDGRFRVEAFVAAGGFGLVYRATHLRWNRPVAVKVLASPMHPDDEKDLVDAFLREGAVQNDLARQCLGVVQTYDVGTWIAPDGKSRLYLVLEWLAGHTLAEYRRLFPARWTLSDVLTRLGPVAEALATAHRRGIAHRDVKPGNLFVLAAEADGTPPAVATKLLDFGVAKVASERGGGFLSTGGEATAFTVGYAAPEQLARAHGSTGPWTDVHAMALICAELLSGKLPYGSHQPLRAMASALDPNRRPTPLTLGVPVSTAVEAVFVRALSMDIGARHADAGAFWEALKAADALAVPEEDSALTADTAQLTRLPTLNGMTDALRPPAEVHRTAMQHAPAPVDPAHLLGEKLARQTPSAAEMAPVTAEPVTADPVTADPASADLPILRQPEPNTEPPGLSPSPATRPRSRPTVPPPAARRDLANTTQPTPKVPARNTTLGLAAAAGLAVLAAVVALLVWLVQR
jgi:serine/threonine protein kinase